MHVVGINLSCASNVKHVNNNHVKVIGDVPVAPRESVSDAHTPTIDYMDDSYVSEENNSTANSSNAEQGGISIYNNSTEAQSSASYHHFNNNLVSSKNRNALNPNQPPPATSIIHLSPGGSTVIEYKSASNLQQQLNSVSMQSNSPMNDRDYHYNNGGAEYCGDMKGSPTSNASAPHQHFHKKYIKQMNALNGSPIAVTTVSAIVSLPNAITVNSPSTTTYTIPLNQDYSNSIKYADHETIIVENEYTYNGDLHHNAIEIDRTDDYVTPMSSPRHQQTPSTPQKLLSTATIFSPSGASMTSSVQSSPTTTMPPVSPLSQNKQKHPNNLPYDPFIHTNNKPPLSFSSLIFLAIEDAQEKALPVKEIYAWIVQHYPYFKTAPTGWKNSVRHNLSLNKCFQKVEKAPVSVVRDLTFTYSFRNFNFSHPFSQTEHGQRIAVARRATVQTKFSHCIDSIIIPPEHDRHGKSHRFV